MKRLKFIIQLGLFIIILLLCNKVNAASITLVPSKNTVTVEDEFTVSMNLSGANLASLNVKITFDTSKVEYLSSSAPNNTNFNNGKILYTWTDTSGGLNPKTSGNIVTFKLKASSAGTVSFNISGNFYDVDENVVNMSLSGTNVTINNIVPVTPPEEPSTEPEIPNQPEQPDIPENPNVPENPSVPDTPPPESQIPDTPTTPQQPEQPSATENNNQLSSNSYLKSLQVNIEGISPKFNKNTTRYYLTVENTIDAIIVNAVPEDNNAKVEIKGDKNLQIGNNEVNIIVIAQNGNTRNYIINVNKTNDPNNANTNLENLAIENVILTPEFSADVLEYSASVGSDIETLNILAVPEIEEAKITITGGDKLAFGNNIIVIAVTSRDGTGVKNYSINVYRKTEVEEIEEQQELLEESNTAINNNSNNLIENSTESSKNNVWLRVLFCILVIIMIGIIIYIIRNSKNKKG